MPVHDDTGDDVIGAFGLSARGRAFDDDDDDDDDDDVLARGWRLVGVEDDATAAAKVLQPMLASNAMR